MPAPDALSFKRDDWHRLATSPTAVLFLSSNVANAANLLFNMLFARLMGPDLFSDLALLLTLKLAGLSLFSAIQFGVSKAVASGSMQPNPQAEADMMAGISKLSFKICIPLCIVLFACAEWLATLVSLSDPRAILLVILTIPALIPISLYRGAAYGRIDLPRIVASLQFEWLVRFAGGILLWQAGIGLLGVTAALTASVYIAAICATQPGERAAWTRRQSGSNRALLKILEASSPFLAIQIAQILMLDGDLFIAKALLPAEQAGYLAALGLIQRIFFFAFLSFATLLLPMVARKTAEQDVSGARRDLTNMLAALSALAIIPLVILMLAAPFISTLLFGPLFEPMAPWAPYAAMSALSFAIAHLVVTYLIAREQTGAAYAFAAIALLQFGAVSLIAIITPTLATIVISKFLILVLVAVLALAVIHLDKS